MKKKISILILAAVLASGIFAFSRDEAPQIKINEPVAPAMAPAEPHKILEPENYHGQAVPLIIWFHGSGQPTGNEEGLTAFETVAPNTYAFLKAGYLVVSSNAHGDNWGNEQSQQDYVDLYNYVKSKYPITNTYFWATSMGGLDSLLVLRSGKIPAKAYAGMSPVTDFDSVYNNERLGPLVKAQWKGHPTIKGPNQYHDYPDIPYLFYASYEDTYVVRAENIDKLDVPNKTVRTTRGDHTDPQNFVQPAALVKFFDSIEK